MTLRTTRHTAVRAMLAAAVAVPSLMLAAGPASAAPEDIVGVANANLDHHACDTNSAGQQGYNSSCTGDGGSPENWCADFVAWAWAQAGYDVNGLSPAAGSFAEYGAGLHPDPHVGDAVVFDYRGNGSADHVAIVTAVNGDGSIESTGGNEVTEDAATSTVHHDGPYSGAVGDSSYWNMAISGYVSPTNRP
ncbi:CHAP domain-containing protein (plasmid) [Streptomyces sp. BHT-5-2]|uniref:CHAP domain-containing protein n=1 Tax=unclassified Streptomyces TaxID=2593676 RepID=UPI001C8DE960|nr:CHAP domain-containing protein [Streptomyces sp. BHT-5-2]QZL07835.1 CHAP domain-containing protein [Streptomyces sp. BHT-5-2]